MLILFFKKIGLELAFVITLENYLMVKRQWKIIPSKFLLTLRSFVRLVKVKLVRLWSIYIEVSEPKSVNPNDI